MQPTGCLAASAEGILSERIRRRILGVQEFQQQLVEPGGALELGAVTAAGEDVDASVWQ
jgi:hypothetical protein